MVTPLCRGPESARRQFGRLFSRKAGDTRDSSDDGKFTIAQVADLDTERTGVGRLLGRNDYRGIGKRRSSCFQCGYIGTDRQLFSHSATTSRIKLLLRRTAVGSQFNFTIRNYGYSMRQSGKPVDPGIAGQGNISAAAFSGENKLLVADPLSAGDLIRPGYRSDDPPFRVP